MTTFWASFGEIWANFYSTIWSHCMQLRWEVTVRKIIKFPISLRKCNCVPQPQESHGAHRMSLSCNAIYCTPNSDHNIASELRSILSNLITRVFKTIPVSCLFSSFPYSN